MDKFKEKIGNWYNKLIVFLIRPGRLKIIIFLLIIGIFYFKIIPEDAKIYISQLLKYIIILAIILIVTKIFEDIIKVYFIIKEFKIELGKNNCKNQILDCIKFKKLIYNDSQEAIKKVHDLYKVFPNEKVNLEIMEVKIKLKQDKSATDIIPIFTIPLSALTLFFNFIKESIPSDDGTKVKTFQDMLPITLKFFLALLFILIIYLFIKTEYEEIFKFKKYIWELKLNVLEKVKEDKETKRLRKIKRLKRIK